MVAFVTYSIIILLTVTLLRIVKYSHVAIIIMACFLFSNMHVGSYVAMYIANYVGTTLFFDVPDV